jgi:hypothetical protein
VHRVGDLGDGDLRRWRLLSQGLVGPGCAPSGEGAAEVVRRSGAVQSQDHQPALWSLARRCCGPGGVPPTEAVLGAAYDSAAFLRLHVLRPTWHFVPPERQRALIALTGPRLAASMAGRWRELGLPAELRARATAVLAAAIAEGGPLTRAGAKEVLERSGVGVHGQRLPHLLAQAELDGVLTSGPAEGRQHTWALVADRTPPAPVSPPDPDEVVRDLVLAFVRSHAPATERDLSWWAGLPLTVVRKGLEAARPEVDVLEAGGRTYWHAGAPPELGHAPDAPAVHLVQSYDEYLVAHTESRGLADPHGFAEHMPRGWLLGPGVLVDGVLTGHWRRVVSPRRVDVVVTPFVPLTRQVRAELEAEAGRYAAFVDRPLRLVLEEVLIPMRAATSGPPTTSA